MPSLMDWKPSDPIQLLIFGGYKLGKTAGALTFPRPVVFDFDRGIAVGRSPWFVAKYGMRDIQYEQFQDKGMRLGVPTQHVAFDTACRYYDEWMKPRGKWVSPSTGKTDVTGNDMFDTFIIDSGTTLSEFAQFKAVQVIGGMKLSKTYEHAASTGVLVPKMQDYGSERSLVEQFVDMVKSSGKNVILICHEKQIIDDDTEAVTDIVPLLTGKSAVAVPLKFDEVYNYRTMMKGLEVVRYLQTQPDALRRVGTRYGIADKSAWDYDTIKTQIDSIHKQQQEQSRTHAVPVTTK